VCYALSIYGRNACNPMCMIAASFSRHIKEGTYICRYGFAIMLIVESELNLVLRVMRALPLMDNILGIAGRGETGAPVYIYSQRSLALYFAGSDLVGV
jgi:hypothetical protein